MVDPGGVQHLVEPAAFFVGKGSIEIDRGVIGPARAVSGGPGRGVVQEQAAQQREPLGVFRLIKLLRDRDIHADPALLLIGQPPVQQRNGIGEENNRQGFLFRGAQHGLDRRLRGFAAQEFSAGF